MARYSPKSNSQSRYHFQSINWPAKSDLSTIRIEQVVTKPQILEASASSKAESICSFFYDLGELHKCIQELLSLQPISQNIENWVKGLLEESIRYIDICSNTRDMVMQIRENVCELQSALRRRGDLSLESIVKAYFCTRKKMKKEIYKCLKNLKHPHHLNAIPMCDSNEDNLSATTMRFLQEASIKTASILESLLFFLLAQPNSRRSLVSKFLHKGVRESEGQHDKMSELEKLEMELSKDVATEDRIQSLQRTLEALDSKFQGLEHGLESSFRHLIDMRVCLLNILSDHSGPL